MCTHRLRAERVLERGLKQQKHRIGTKLLATGRACWVADSLSDTAGTSSTDVRAPSFWEFCTISEYAKQKRTTGMRMAPPFAPRRESTESRLVSSHGALTCRMTLTLQIMRTRGQILHARDLVYQASRLQAGHGRQHKCNVPALQLQTAMFKSGSAARTIRLPTAAFIAVLHRVAC